MASREVTACWSSELYAYLIGLSVRAAGAGDRGLAQDQFLTRSSEQIPVV